MKKQKVKFQITGKRDQVCTHSFVNLVVTMEIPTQLSTSDGESVNMMKNRLHEALRSVNYGVGEITIKDLKR